MAEEYIIQDLFKEYRYSLKKIKNKLKKINKFENLGDSLIEALSEMFNNHFDNFLSYYDTYYSDELQESLCSRIEKFYNFVLNKEKNVSLEKRSFYWKVICCVAYGLIKEPENDGIFYVKDIVFKMVEEDDVELLFDREFGKSFSDFLSDLDSFAGFSIIRKCTPDLFELRFCEMFFDNNNNRFYSKNLEYSNDTPDYFIEPGNQKILSYKTFEDHAFIEGLSEEDRLGFENINLKLFKFMMLIYISRFRNNDLFDKEIEDFKSEILSDKYLVKMILLNIKYISTEILSIKSDMDYLSSRTRCGNFPLFYEVRYFLIITSVYTPEQFNDLIISNNV
jgi:hypothetical protein